jgi:four helix bundle protein
MTIRHFRELIAWQLADAFESEVVRLLQSSQGAWRDFSYRDEILDALSSVPSNIAEGFTRRSPREVCRFLDYSLSSLSEVEVRLASGIKRRYFDATQCAEAMSLARRTLTATVRFKQSQVRYLARIKAQPPPSRRGRRSESPKPLSLGAQAQQRPRKTPTTPDSLKD